jgi:hypothetical protein
MSSSGPQELTPLGAADRLARELAQARQALSQIDLSTALDCYVRALGLALQLGPVPTERTLKAILEAAVLLANLRHAEGLSALSPALVGLVERVRRAGVLPATDVMEAWATFATDLSTLIGQVGLALSIPPDHRQPMLHNAQTRAALLDEATGHRFALSDWLDQVAIHS